MNSNRTARADDIIRDTLGLISEPSSWCQGSIAQTGTGLSCDHSDPEATAWCLVGALRASQSALGASNKTFDNALDRVHVEAKKLFSRSRKTSFIASFNDHHKTKHADVLTVLRSALKR